MEQLDKTDYIILNLLKENYRMSPEEIAARVELPLDEVNERINRMIKAHIFFPKAQFFSKTLKKLEQLDEKDCILLNRLQENCRISLTELSAAVGLSIDSVKKRIERMIRNHIFYPKIQIRPRNFGFKNIVDIKVKLHNYNDRELQEFIEFLENHVRVAELFTVAGEWDISMVIIAKDAEDLGKVREEIRGRFSKIILGWSESLTTCVYKFERYNMLKLLGYEG